MGHAGVTCIDCHNPHSAKLKLPVENNALCMSCHSPPGQRGAIPITDAMAHSHHAAESPGNRCVDCHMPQTTYMARDARRDHGFTIPDPLLTKELGVPNSCNRCHTNSRRTGRSIGRKSGMGKNWIALRGNGRNSSPGAVRDPSVSGPIIEFFKGEPNAAWRASLVSMLDGREGDPSVQDFFARAATDESPLVRAAAVRGLERTRPDVLSKATSDPSRNVRLSASWQLLMNRQSLLPGPREEIEKYLRNSSDQVGGAFYQARLAAVENRVPEMEHWAEIATARDPSSDMLNQAAHLMYQANRLPKAKDFFDKALGANPDNADATYSLALLEAELGSSARSLQLLRKTVSLTPDFGRASYNSALRKQPPESFLPPQKRWTRPPLDCPTARIQPMPSPPFNCE